MGMPVRDHHRKISSPSSIGALTTFLSCSRFDWRVVVGSARTLATTDMDSRSRAIRVSRCPTPRTPLLGQPRDLRITGVCCGMIEADALASISNDDLFVTVRRLTARSNVALADLLAHLGEVDRRGLHRLRACASLYTYCIYELRMSEEIFHSLCTSCHTAFNVPTTESFKS